MNHSAIVRNFNHEHDDDDVKNDKKNTHDKNSNGADNADNDYVYFLLSIFPNNTDNNPIKSVYTSRETTGRVVSMETCLKVPQTR
jgi:hypothetical protein